MLLDIRAVDTVYDGHLTHRWRDGMYAIRRNRYARGGTVDPLLCRFDDRVETRESYCILVCCMAAVLCHGGELLLVHLCGEVDFSRSPRPHDDVTLTDLIMARHIAARES